MFCLFFLSSLFSFSWVQIRINHVSSLFIASLRLSYFAAFLHFFCATWLCWKRPFARLLGSPLPSVSCVQTNASQTSVKAATADTFLLICSISISIMKCLWYDMIYLLTAIGLSPGGRSTVHIYTQTINRTIPNKQYVEQHNNFGRVRAVPRLG